MFLRYDWLVKHNPEVNWNMGKIQFTRCPKTYRMQYQDISFKTRRIQSTDNQNKEYQEIGKELDLINPENLPDYIQPLTLVQQEEVRKVTRKMKMRPQN